MCTTNGTKRHKLSGEADLLVKRENAAHMGIDQLMMHTCMWAHISGSAHNACTPIYLAACKACYNSSTGQLIKTAAKTAPGPGPSQCGACAATYGVNATASLRSVNMGLPLTPTDGVADVSCGSCSAIATLAAVILREWDW